jgi:hypothetical protein
MCNTFHPGLQILLGTNHSQVMEFCLFRYIKEASSFHLDPTIKHNCVPEYSLQIFLPPDFFFLLLVEINSDISSHYFPSIWTQRINDFINLQEK